MISSMASTDWYHLEINETVAARPSSPCSQLYEEKQFRCVGWLDAYRSFQDARFIINPKFGIMVFENCTDLKKK